MARYKGFFFEDTEWVSPNAYNYADHDFDLGVAPNINIVHPLPPAPQIIFRDIPVVPDQAFEIPVERLEVPVIENIQDPAAQIEPNNLPNRFEPQPGGLADPDPEFEGIPDWLFHDGDRVQINPGIVDPDPNFDGIPDWFYEGGNDFVDLPGLDNLAVEPDRGIDIGDGFRLNLDPVYDNGPSLPDHDFFPGGTYDWENDANSIYEGDYDLANDFNDD